MNEPTKRILSRTLLPYPLPVSLSLSPSASGRGAPDPRTALSRARQVDEPSRSCSLPRGPRSTLVCRRARSLTRSRVLAPACVRVRAYSKRACVSHFRRVRCSSSAHYIHTHGHTRTRNFGRRRKWRGGGIYLSFSLYASRTAVPVSRNQRLRFLLIDLILSPLSSLFLSLSLFSLPSCGPVVVSPSAPRGRCPTSFRHRLPE